MRQYGIQNKFSANASETERYIAFVSCVGMFKPMKKTRCQFHWRFIHSFYASRFQKCKNYSQVISQFALLGFTSVKAAHKHVGEIDPRSHIARQVFICNASLIYLRHILFGLKEHSVLGLIQTRHFGTQYCDKRYCNNKTFLSYEF